MAFGAAFFLGLVLGFLAAGFFAAGFLAFLGAAAFLAAAGFFVAGFLVAGFLVAVVFLGLVAFVAAVFLGLAVVVFLALGAAAFFSPSAAGFLAALGFLAGVFLVVVFFLGAACRAARIRGCQKAVLHALLTHQVLQSRHICTAHPCMHLSATPRMLGTATTSSATSYAGTSADITDCKRLQLQAHLLLGRALLEGVAQLVAGLDLDQLALAAQVLQLRAERLLPRAAELPVLLAIQVLQG